MKYADYLRCHQFALRLLGLWPSPGYGFSLSGYSAYTISFLGVFCAGLNASEFANFFFLINGELKPFASDLCWFVMHFVSGLKIVVFISKIRDVQRVCARLAYGLSIRDKKRGDKDGDFDRAVKASITIVAVYYAFSVAVLFNGFIAPLYRDSNSNSDSNATRPQRLPYYTYVYCDSDASPCYEIAYAYQILSTCVFSLVIIHLDNLYLFIVMLCCSEFAELSRTLQDLVPEREYYQRWKDCVRHHQAILEVSGEIEGIYSLIILAQFLSHLVQICFQLFLVTEVSATSFDGLSMIAFVVSMVIQVYVFCLWGSELETQSTRVAEAAYNARWIASSEPVNLGPGAPGTAGFIVILIFSLPLRRTLLLVMLRAQKPVRFTVGNFAKLSLRALLSVLKLSFSYFTVLREAQ